MKTNLFPYLITTVSLAAFIPAMVFAGPNNPEPRRIYDIASGNVIDNPSYHKPARKERGVRSEEKTTEPRRIYDIATRQFEDNPDYRDPAAVNQTNPRLGRARSPRKPAAVRRSVPTMRGQVIQIQ